MTRELIYHTSLFDKLTRGLIHHTSLFVKLTLEFIYNTSPELIYRTLFDKLTRELIDDLKILACFFKPHPLINTLPHNGLLSSAVAIALGALMKNPRAKKVISALKLTPLRR